MEKTYNVCVIFSGCLDYSVKAENEEEAAKKAEEMAKADDWNKAWGPEFETADIYEEV